MGDDMSEYSEKLKNPKWQKRRLEILSRDNWTCLVCGDTTSTLNVHHKWYEKGLDPWEYQDNCLATLCESCHNTEYSLQPYRDNILNVLLEKGLFMQDICDMAFNMSRLDLSTLKILADIGQNFTIIKNTIDAKVTPR